ncbi:DUF1365 family protein [bacterium]|nr:DUF1365 family protein [bacterium]
MNHIFLGSLFHKRFNPKEHVFKYPIYFFGLDCDRLAETAQKIMFFGHNSFNLFSIYDRDYLKDTGEPLGEKVRELLREKGYESKVDFIRLLTSARCMGVCFNPVNFYYCYHHDCLKYILAEVNNTFGERHTYVLECDSDKDVLKAKTKKEFYVSPFFAVDGDYFFKLSAYDKNMSLSIDYKKDDVLQLTATLSGNRLMMHSLQLLKTIIAMPFSGVATFLRILFEAFRLKFLLKLSLVKKGHAMNTDTFKTSSPTFFQRFGKSVFISQLEVLEHGCLEVQFPSGLVKRYGDPVHALKGRLWIKDHRFFSRVLFRHEVGLGESFMYGEWDSDSVKDILFMFQQHMTAMSSKKIWATKIIVFFGAVQHFFRRNTVRKSKKNITEHYDLNNDFFKYFLDDSMMYSCAVYPTKETSLKEAQYEKMNALIKKAAIKPDHHVLEIGSGWGAMAIHMAKTVGCKVTTVTISKEQYAYAKKLIAASDVAENINLVFQDYRNIDGEFDRVVSIEMIEAVGHAFLPGYFKKIDSLLVEGGKAVIQGITINDNVYHQYRKRTDWIRKYIFPGGHLPSISYIKECTESLSLSLESLEEIGEHYVQTLEDWKKMFVANVEDIKALGFDDVFVRKWLYYFYYSQAGFMSKYINDHHLVFSK